MFHGHPAASLTPLRLSRSSTFPEEAPAPLSIALTCTRLPSSSAISRRRGGGERIRQLFCFDDSIIPFSGISISIIILIIAFDTKNYQTSLKSDVYQPVCGEFLSFPRDPTSLCDTQSDRRAQWDVFVSKPWRDPVTQTLNFTLLLMTAPCVNTINVWFSD